MINIPKNGKIKVSWKPNIYDYSRDREKEIITLFSKKYNIPKEQIKIEAKPVNVNKLGKEVSISKDIVENVQKPSFHHSLFKRYLRENNIENYDYEIFNRIDSEINALIDYDEYDKHKHFSINWIKWSNFLSYGEDNFFDFRNLKGLILLNGEPANQSGKTTFAIDLLHFLLYGKTSKTSTLDKTFNKHLPETTKLYVEGSLMIDGEEIIIRRTLKRTSLEKRTSKTRVSQDIEFFKVINGELTELEDIDDKREESTTKTNKAIKDAIGKEEDFDMIISTTSSNLDELIEKKDTERGRLLTRWIGLLPLERKDELARKKYNEEVKPYLLSKRYNSEELKREISLFETSNKTLEKEVKDLNNENQKIDKEIEELEENKNTLISAKRKIDEEVLKIDITTVKTLIEKIKTDGSSKKEKFNKNIKRIEEIGDVEFSIEELNKLSEEKGELTGIISLYKEKARTCKSNKIALETSEVCPTCGRKYENVDNSAKIKELEEEYNEIVKIGIEKTNRKEQVEKLIKEINERKDLYEEKAKLVTENSSLEFNISNLKNAYKEQNDLLTKYHENHEAIDINNKLDIDINNIKFKIKDRNNTKETNIKYIEQKTNLIENNNVNINERKNIINKIEEEIILERHWSIYLDMIGKNGISKMVLRNALPYINVEINSMLSEVCDFTVEIEITDKQEVIFYLIKDGVKSELSSGSGFEKTASALALRTVLGETSSLSKLNGLILDEVWGRVAKENYDKMKLLCDKMLKYYDYIIQISHLDEIKDWHDHIITVTKVNNVSKINVVK